MSKGPKIDTFTLPLSYRLAKIIEHEWMSYVYWRPTQQRKLTVKH